MKQFYLIFILVCKTLLANSQGENNIWYFGFRAGLDFNSGSPVVLTNAASTFSAWGYSSAVSDSSGNFLFSVSLNYVYNRNNQVMPNGTILGTNADLQPTFVVKKMDEDSVYYLFTMDIWPYPTYPDAQGLRYTIVDLRLDGGLGDIPPGQKSIVMPGAELTTEMLTGTRAQNNKDAWIVVRKYQNSNEFLTYHITNAGIDMNPVVSYSLITLLWPNELSSNDPMMIRFSPDGTKLVAMYDSISEMCNFNSSTGEITPLFRFIRGLVGISTNDANAEFSVDNRYLYIAEDNQGGSNPYRIYQFDASKTDSAQFKQSEIVIAQHNYFCALQGGPDNKIYSSHSSVDSLDVINKPAMQGLACNYQRDAICLEGYYARYGLVQQLQRYYVYIQHASQCEGNPIAFTSLIWPQPDSIHWDFGDPASGPANFSFNPNPSHTYSLPGSYTVMLFVRHIDKRADTAWQMVTVYPTYRPSLGPDRSVCLGTSVTFDAGACTGCSYQWTNLTTDLQVGTGQTYTTGQAGIYEAAVTNTFGCVGRDTVQLITDPQPAVTNDPLSKTICSGESTNIGLTSDEPATNFHWTATLTLGNITGFGADSGLVINQVLTNNGAFAGIVTYHITPKLGGCSGNMVDFPVTVNPGDSVKVSISASTNNVCSGTSVTFQAVPTNGGTAPSYQWKVNGINSGPDNPVFTYPPGNGDVVTCILTSSNTVCTSNNPATSNQVMMVIISNSVVSVSITASANPVCAGNSVTFTATPTNGGSSPSYIWKVNGITVGTNSPTYNYNPASGDVVSCILSSNILCPTGNPATSNMITMTVNPNLPVNVSISASDNPFCQGSSVIFTATPVNGGGTPVYQWKVNGINFGINSPTYTYTPLNGDLVSCVLTSSILCPIANPVTSNILIMNMNNNLPAGIFITASTNPFCPGNSVTFTANPVNGGSNPAYQWKVNGANSGSNSPTYIYNPASGDLVSCILTSNLTCVTANPATSNTIIMSGTLGSIVTFTLCNDSVTTTIAKPFKLKGGIPLGGFYSGPGVINGIFNPAIAGVGTHQIAYTYTNAALCSVTGHRSLITINPAPFICGNPVTDIRDGKIYQTVKIGSQCWLAEDLNYGNEITSTQNQRDNCIPEKYHNPASSIQYPVSVYQWDELMNYDESTSNQGLCPPAWHVPSEADWNTLFANYTNNGFAASPLKYSGFSGFNAILSGARHLNKTWDWPGFSTFFWSSTSHGTTKAWAQGMNDLDPSVSNYPALRNNAFSVRCLRDF